MRSDTLSVVQTTMTDCRTKCTIKSCSKAKGKYNQKDRVTIGKKNSLSKTKSSLVIYQLEEKKTTSTCMSKKRKKPPTEQISNDKINKCKAYI